MYNTICYIIMSVFHACIVMYILANGNDLSLSLSLIELTSRSQNLRTKTNQRYTVYTDERFDTGTKLDRIS